MLLNKSIKNEVRMDKSRPENIIKEQLDDLKKVKIEWLKNEEKSLAYKMKLNFIIRQEQELKDEKFCKFYEEL